MTGVPGVPHDGASAKARQPGGAPQLTEWEYKLIGLSDLDSRGSGESGGNLESGGSLEAKLNELGAEGWELVAYVGYTSLDSMVLKRPKQPEKVETEHSRRRAV